MRTEDEVKDLRAREARALQSVVKLKAEVLPILAVDLARYPEREVRKRFVSNPEFADTLDDASIARLKAEISKRALEMRDRVVALMDDDERWLAGVDFAGPGKSFAENPRLWDPTGLAVDLVRQLLTDYGFPKPEEYPTEYRMPTWFIEGKYLPGLAEKYWACMNEVREVRQRIREVEEGLVRNSLGRRWDRVGVGNDAERGVPKEGLEPPTRRI